MRILLDESLPHRLRAVFPDHEVFTVAEVGRSGRQNGELLQLAAARFDLFVTADQNLQYQQNLSSLPLSVAVLAGRDNRYETLLPLAAHLLARLPQLTARTFIRCDGQPLAQPGRSPAALLRRPLGAGQLHSLGVTIPRS